MSNFGHRPPDTLDYSLGRLADIRVVNLFGRNLDISPGTPEDVWPAGGLYPFQAAAVALEVVSSSADDAAAGTGLRTVQILGLDANYAEISHVATLNGLTPVALPGTWLRVNNLAGVTGGSVATNVGTITVRVPGPGVTQGVIAAGQGRSHQAIYTVPAGWSAAVPYLTFGVQRATADVAEFQALVRPFGGVWSSGTNVTSHSQAGQTQIIVPYPVVLPPKTDARIHCASVSAPNQIVSVSAQFVLIRTG